MASGWAFLNGEEIFNEARTSSYIRKGLGGPHLTVGRCACCDSLSVDPDGTVHADYVSPAADPAPWYDASEPASGEFLGFLVQLGGLDSTLSRQVSSVATGRGGGSLSRLLPKERTITVTGHVVAGTQRGQDYGMRWLTSRLAQSLACDGCALDELEIQLACPADDQDPQEVRWTLRDVGVLEGPVYSGDTGLGCAELRPFDLTLVSEHAYLYQKVSPACLPAQGFPLPPPEACVPFCDWWSTVYQMCCDLTPPSPVDDMATIVRVYAGTDAASFDLTVSDGQGCPPGGSARRARIPVLDLPAGSTLTIDSSTERISLLRADGVTVDGFPYLQLDADTAFDWMSLGCGGSSAGTCVCVEARMCAVNYATTVEIEAVRRRL